MSMVRFFHWTCDVCKITTEREDYGLPRGWIFVKARTTTHRCPECQADVPRDRIGYPKVTAEK